MAKQRADKERLIEEQKQKRVTDREKERQKMKDDIKKRAQMGNKKGISFEIVAPGMDELSE